MSRASSIARNRARVFGRVLSACAALALVPGCATTLVPPAGVERGTRVLVLDHGRHTSLVISVAKQRSVRYAYGEWRWFAERRQGFLRVFPVLFWPTTGALGRRALDRAATADALEGHVPTIRHAWSFEVPAKAATALRSSLDRRFARAISGAVARPEYALTFVPDPRSYSLAHNSNHAVARWLRELGVTVRGWPVLARWRVVEPQASGKRASGLSRLPHGDRGAGLRAFRR